MTKLFRRGPQAPDGLAAAIETLTQKVDTIMATLADIQTKLAAETSAETAILQLLSTISAELHAALAADDPDAIQAVADHLDANTAALTAAVVANTPAAPATVAASAPAPAAATGAPATGS